LKKKETFYLYKSGLFSHLDIHFARLMSKLVQNDKEEIFLAAAVLSHYHRQGHICLDLSKAGEKYPNLTLPELREWLTKLKKSDVIGSSGEYKPLILDDKSRLYLYRYWFYQDKLAELIRKRVENDIKNIDYDLLEKGLQRLFPNNQDDETDWQKIAAFTAVTKRFCVISGGPGTGKTSTVAKILALIIEQAKGEKLQIALAAPTGKAAARLQDAMIHAKEKGLPDSPHNITDAIPEQASTLHRLLGSIPGTPYFRHHAKNLLNADVVAVDEASMVDMALISKLIQAIPDESRLILLGDKDQLASVEAGAVLGDICEDTQPFIIQLRKNYRFKEESGIRKVSDAVNKGDADNALKYLKDENYKDIIWKNLPEPDYLSLHIRDIVINGFKDYLLFLQKTTGNDKSGIFEKFNQFRILCALRQGHYGMITVNKLAEQILRRAKLISSDNTWYPGRPVMVTHNDYNLRLFNGDIGIAMPDPDADNEIRVFFSPDVQSKTASLRKFNPLRLPEHETVFAMTVHKSQGSEFNRVLLLLSDKDYTIMTRELIYTGITRAISHVELWGKEDIFSLGVSRRIERTSGLSDALRKSRV